MVCAELNCVAKTQLSRFISQHGPPAKDHLRRMRASGVRDGLIWCRDHRCSYHVETNADGWGDDVRLSNIEDRFVCQVWGRRGADVRPKFRR
jgi:hypothetical protein